MSEQIFALQVINFDGQKQSHRLILPYKRYRKTFKSML